MTPNDVLVERARSLVFMARNRSLDEAVAEMAAALAGIEASPAEQMREALIDWRNCWCCPATAFDGEVDRLIAQTDAALQLTDKGRVDNG